MLNRFVKPAFVAFGLLMSTVAMAQADAAAMLRKVDAIRAPGSNFSFDVKVATSDGTSMQMSVTVKDSTKGLVRYSQPSNVEGRSLLFVDRNMWVFIPGSRRALRISPQQQVLGGVSSADVARTVYSADYSVSGMDDLGGGKQVLHLDASSGSAAYSKIDLTVDADSGKPVEADFFSSGGKRKLKTVYFEGYKSVLGASRPTKLRIVDHLAGDAVTTMTYSGYALTDTPDAWFQPDYLSRL